MAGFVRGRLLGGGGAHSESQLLDGTQPDGKQPDVKQPDGAAIPLFGRWHFPRALVAMAPGLNLDSRWQA